MNCADPPLTVAQTNLQLYRQMELEAYTVDDVGAVADAYFGALPFFSAQYRGNGKPFITHLVGTASILVSRRAPLAQVLAGLLHAAYQTGDLGVDTGRHQTPARREVLARLIGEEAEDLVSVYDATDWNGRLASGDLRNRELPDERARGATYLFLANTLEDFLDGGMCGLAGTRKSGTFGLKGQGEVVALANDLDWPELATAVQAEFDRFNGAGYGAPSLSDSGYSALLLPPSARRAPVAVALSFIARTQRRLLRRLGRRP